MPAVTVLMAVYNGEPFLSQAIASILEQTWRDFEFLIVDDGSTDRTEEVIRGYDDRRIRLISNDRNLGLPRTLNRGLGLATGTFVARQDADDIAEPDRLARQIAFCAAHPDVALVGTWYREIDEAGVAGPTLTLPRDHTAICWDLLFYCPFVHSAALWRREVVRERVGPYDESLAYAQDYQLWQRIADRLPVANIALPLVRVRAHPGSMTATYGPRTEEGPRLGVARVGKLLGWDPAAVATNRVRFDAMGRLLYDVGPPPSLRAARAAVPELLRLHRAFCLHLGLGPGARLRRRLALYARLGGRLVALGGRATGRIAPTLRREGPSRRAGM